MLDAKFFYQARGEYSRCERTTEDIAKLGIETTNAHILELEVGC